MTWHGQINRTIWEIEHLIKKTPSNFRLRRELLRTHFLQHYEVDKTFHVPRDDRSFLFMQEKRAPGCLLIHGANGTPAEMRDLGNFLYSKGMTVYCPRFSRYDVKNRMVSWESWVTMAESAMNTMQNYSKVNLLVGLSMGATVAMILERLCNVRGVVLLAPALFPRLGIKGYAVSLARYITPGLFYRMAGWNGEAVKAMEYFRKQKEPIQAPALVMQARDDRVLSTKGLKFLKKRATHKGSEIVLLPQGSHAIIRGQARDEVFDRMYEFTKKIKVT